MKAENERALIGKLFVSREEFPQFCEKFEEFYKILHLHVEHISKFENFKTNLMNNFKEVFKTKKKNSLYADEIQKYIKNF